MIIGDILIGVFLLLLLNVSIVMARRIGSVVLKSNYVTIFRYELMLCAVLLIFSFDVRTGFLTGARLRAARVAGWIFRVMIGLSACAILFYFGKIMLGFAAVPDPSAKYAIVLGMALEDGKPTADLLYRLDAAQAYLERRPDVSLILTGGNADGSGQTEAEVMQALLVERGLPAEKLLLEDKAETTKENFTDVAAMIDPSSPVVIITSNYHMDRATATAKQAGFTNVSGLPAHSDPLCFGANMLWEVMLELNDLAERASGRH